MLLAGGIFLCLHDALGWAVLNRFLTHIIIATVKYARSSFVPSVFSAGNL